MAAVYGGARLRRVSSRRRSRPHPVHPTTLLVVAVGGAVGAALRWGLEQLLPVVDGWSWATLLANVLGSAALALVVVHGERHAHPHWVRPGVGTGLLGGFTTYSTYAVQVALLGGADPVLGLLYLVLTPVLCVGAAAGAGGLALRARGRQGSR